MRLLICTKCFIIICMLQDVSKHVSDHPQLYTTNKQLLASINQSMNQ